LPLTVAGVALTLASLAWLSQSSALTATGTRIYRLEQERQALQLRRAAVYGAYADATNPHRLEERARALGLGPMPAADVVQVELSPEERAPLAIDPRSALHTVLAVGERPQGRARPLVGLLAGERVPGAEGGESVAVGGAAR
jgi:hypothetical protein